MSSTLPVGRLEPDDLAQLDVLLLGILRRVELVLEGGRPRLAVGEHRVGELLHERDEVARPSPEKSVSALSSTIAARLPSRAMAIAPWLFSRSSSVATLRQALLAQDLGGLVTVAVGLDERLLGVHHPGAGGVTQRLDVLAR